MKRVITVLLSFVFLWILTPLCLGEEYPSKPVKLVIPWGAGGSTDIVGRMLAAKAGKKLGQPIVVENVPGGSGTLGIATVAKAKPDGYTLALAPGSAFQRSPHMMSVNYDPFKDFIFICKLLDYDNCVIILNDKPYKTFKELVAYAKANPRKVVYAVPGALEGGYIAMTYVANQEAIKWKRVPYTSGAEAMAAVLGGHADFFAGGGVGGNLELVRAGKARVVVVYSEMRWENLPDVPTLKELGYNHVNSLGMGITAPAGLPENIRQKLEAIFLDASRDPEFVALANRMALVFNRLKGPEYLRSEKEGCEELGKMLDSMGLKKK